MKILNMILYDSEKCLIYYFFFYVYTIIIKISYNIIFAHDYCELPI